jgi:hypothetical protein
VNLRVKEELTLSCALPLVRLSTHSKDPLWPWRGEEGEEATLLKEWKSELCTKKNIYRTHILHMIGSKSYQEHIRHEDDK